MTGLQRGKHLVSLADKVKTDLTLAEQCYLSWLMAYHVGAVGSWSEYASRALKCVANIGTVVGNNTSSTSIFEDGSVLYRLKDEVAVKTLGECGFTETQLAEWKRKRAPGKLGNA